MTFLYILFACLLVFIAIQELYTFKTGVPTVTSFPSIRRKMVAILKEEISQHSHKKDFEILDLGSGIGQLCHEIARALPETKVTGVEYSLPPYWLSRVRAFLWRYTKGIKNVSFKRDDFWCYDASHADAVVLYINDNARTKMAAKLKKELRTGTLIISNETYLPDWEPIAVHKVSFLKLKVVVYRQSS